MIKAALFDVGGVLVETGNIAEALASDIGLPQQNLRGLLQRYTPKLGVGSMTQLEFWQAAKKEFPDLNIVEEADIIGESFRNILKVRRRVLDSVKELGETGLQLGVLSNTNLPHAEVLSKLGIYSPFDQVYLSHEIGVQKPSPAAFEIALDGLRVAPEEIIYFDDDKENISVANNIGMIGNYVAAEVDVINAINRCKLCR